MTDNVTLQINPLPDRFEFESEIRNLFNDGDLTFIGQMLQIDRTGISKMLSPNVPDRHNPFWLIVAILWSCDLKGSGQADEALRIVERHRAQWQPRLNVRPEPGKSIENMGTLLMRLVRKELSGADENTRLKLAFQLRDECTKHIEEIMALRGLRVSVDGVGDVS